MIIRYYGHAFFRLDLENGHSIAIDPYGEFQSYPKREIKPDLCLISHAHHDHNGRSSLMPGVQIIDRPGAFDTDIGVRITGIPTWHDEHGGEKRGANILYIIEAENMRIAHAGDLGHMLTPEQLAQIGSLDLLMLPVGGFYTIDAQMANRVYQALKPRILVPMHYKTMYYRDDTIASLQAFLNVVGAQDECFAQLTLTKNSANPEGKSIVPLDIAANC